MISSHDSSASADISFDKENIHDCTQITPPEFDLVRLYFTDGRLTYGFWDGEHWRVGEEVIEPEYWQDLTNG